MNRSKESHKRKIWGIFDRSDDTVEDESQPVRPAKKPLTDWKAADLVKLKVEIHRKLLSTLDFTEISGFDTKQNDTELRRYLSKDIAEILIYEDLCFSGNEEKDMFIDEMLDEILGLSHLEAYLRDPDITEIMVNGPHKVFIEKHGRIEATNTVFLNDGQLIRIIEKIVSPVGRRIDESSPMVDARLSDGSRVNAVIPPLSLSGPVLTIRKFSKTPFTGYDLVSFDTLNKEMLDLLRSFVEGKYNILISGGTGSGKTTLLNVLSSFIPKRERIITIEDAAELRLNQEHVISLEARPPNIEGQGAVSIRELVKNALRMRPDRIIVGEVRGAEALDMLQAMNTGHAGSLTTCHANSPKDALSRLETMVLMGGIDLPIRAIRDQIYGAIDVIIQQSRLSNGTRKVTNIVQTTGITNGEIDLLELYHYNGAASGTF